MVQEPLGMPPEMPAEFLRIMPFFAKSAEKSEMKMSARYLKLQETLIRGCYQSVSVRLAA